jgi:4-amino-4-deoxy-L-arabinose transferase-like glycosyltransferase
LLGLGRPAITDSDEAYYAEASREMVESGDWLTPHYNFEFRWQKPILYYWLTAVTYLVFGLGEWSARFWSAAAGLGLAFTTWTAGRRHTGHDDVGWLAGAIVATSFGYLAIGRASLPDLPLAFFITVTIASALDGRWLLAGLAAGLGFLVKGPLALLLPAIVVGPIWWRERHTRVIRPTDVALAALVFSVVALPWYFAMAVEHGTDYLNSFFVGDNFERFATDRFNEPRSPLFYVPVLLGGLLPWTAFVVATAWRPARDLFRRRLTLSDADWRLLIWAVVPLVFFSASIGKQPRYILPILPPIAIFVARGLLHRFDAASRGDRAASREVRIATYASAAFMALVAFILVRARELFITVLPPVMWLAVGALVGCAAILVATAYQGRLMRLPIVMTICAAITLVAVQFGALAGTRPEPVEEMAALVRTHRTADEAIGTYHVFVRNLIFYTGLRHENLYADERALALMRSPDRALMVVRDTDLVRLEAAAGVKMTRLGEVRYFNTANVKLLSLLAPDPDRDIQRVLLVSNR